MSDRRDGFTLIEVLVVVTLMAVIAAVLAATVAVILRNASPTTTRAEDSRSLHGLNTWLARDASATPPGAFNLAAGSTGCTGGSPGNSLVKMTWTENTGTATTYIANYRYVDKGGGDFVVVRYACSGTGAGPYANPSVLNLTSPLSSTTPTVNLVGVPAIGVEMVVVTQEGDQIKVDGGSRNPAETLPSTTTTSTTTTPTTTTIPCALSTINAAPNPVANGATNPSRLSTDVTVTITVSGSCGTLTLHFDRGDGAGPQFKTFSGAFPNFTATLPRSNAEPWLDGPHDLTVRNNGNPISPPITTLTVT